jgi:hypothetical protein
VGPIRGVGEIGYVLNVKDKSPNTSAAGKGYLCACAARDTGTHASSAENSLRDLNQIVDTLYS